MHLSWCDFRNAVTQGYTRIKRETTRGQAVYTWQLLVQLLLRTLRETCNIENSRKAHTGSGSCRVVVDNFLNLLSLAIEKCPKRKNSNSAKPCLFCSLWHSEVPDKQKIQLGFTLMKIGCEWDAVCAGITGVAYRVVGLRGSRSMCRGCWNRTVCARVTWSCSIW